MISIYLHKSIYPPCQAILDEGEDNLESGLHTKKRALAKLARIQGVEESGIHPTSSYYAKAS